MRPIPFVPLPLPLGIIRQPPYQTDSPAMHLDSLAALCDVRLNLRGNVAPLPSLQHPRGVARRHNSKTRGLDMWYKTASARHATLASPDAVLPRDCWARCQVVWRLCCAAAPGDRLAISVANTRPASPAEFDRGSCKPPDPHHRRSALLNLPIPQDVAALLFLQWCGGSSRLGSGAAPEPAMLSGHQVP